MYKIIEIVGTSKNSWEEATKNGIETASKSLEDLNNRRSRKNGCCHREWQSQRLQNRLNLSFKYHGE